MTAFAYIEPIKVIADIIQTEMGLASGQVVVEPQKNMIPKTSGIYIALQYLPGDKIIASSSTLAESATIEGGMEEINEVTVRHIIQVDIMSFDTTARSRRLELPMALRSIYSEQQQTAQCLQIARIPGDLMNASSLEETARLNRFTMSIAVTALQRKPKASLKYYDNFPIPEVHANA